MEAFLWLYLEVTELNGEKATFLSLYLEVTELNEEMAAFLSLYLEVTELNGEKKTDVSFKERNAVPLLQIIDIAHSL
jgi:hypothetical protein